MIVAVNVLGSNVLNWPGGMSVGFWAHDKLRIITADEAAIVCINLNGRSIPFSIIRIHEHQSRIFCSNSSSVGVIIVFCQ